MTDEKMNPMDELALRRIAATPEEDEVTRSLMDRINKLEREAMLVAPWAHTLGNTESRLQQLEHKVLRLERTVSELTEEIRTMKTAVDPTKLYGLTPSQWVVK